MLKKKIKFTDVMGNIREEEFFFHLSKAELIDWITTNSDATLDQVLDTLVRKHDVKSVTQAIGDLIYRSYGEPSPDGRQFSKKPEVKDKFMETEAYSELLMELLNDAEKAAEFLTGIIPKEYSADIKKYIEEHPNEVPLTAGETA